MTNELPHQGLTIKDHRQGHGQVHQVVDQLLVAEKKKKKYINLYKK